MGWKGSEAETGVRQVLQVGKRGGLYTHSLYDNARSRLLPLLCITAAANLRCFQTACMWPLRGVLFVDVKRCRDLLSGDWQGHSSDPYVEVQVRRASQEAWTQTQVAAGSVTSTFASRLPLLGTFWCVQVNISHKDENLPLLHPRPHHLWSQCFTIHPYKMSSIELCALAANATPCVRPSLSSPPPHAHLHLHPTPPAGGQPDAAHCRGAAKPQPRVQHPPRILQHSDA